MNLCVVMHCVQSNSSMHGVESKGVDRIHANHVMWISGQPLQYSGEASMGTPWHFEGSSHLSRIYPKYTKHISQDTTHIRIYPRYTKYIQYIKDTYKMLGGRRPGPAQARPKSGGAQPWAWAGPGSRGPGLGPGLGSAASATAG